MKQELRWFLFCFFVFYWIFFMRMTAFRLKCSTQTAYTARWQWNGFDCYCCWQTETVIASNTHTSTSTSTINLRRCCCCCCCSVQFRFSVFCLESRIRKDGKIIFILQRNGNIDWKRSANDSSAVEEWIGTTRWNDHEIFWIFLFWLSVDRPHRPKYSKSKRWPWYV